ncbi:MAG TPA: Gfo/Idh/MocA family oxidoreductase [Rhizomicrobium sp.]
MTGSIDRREILQGAAALAAAAGLAGSGASAAARPLRVSVVGAGWFGKLNLHCLMQVAPVEAVALCDVDRNMLRDAASYIQSQTDSILKPVAAPALYRDYREMLAKHKFDIVIVATPDHWHTLPAIAAMEAGAHVYLEKPVSVDVVEGQALVAAAKKYNRKVQAGTQRRTAPFMIEAREKVVKGGLLGKVGQVDIFSYYHQRRAHFPPPGPVPEYLDWDFYCGPAPLVPYNPGIHPLNWRSFFAFSNGYMGDMGVHMFDICRFMLDRGWPKRVFSTGGIFIDNQSIATVPDTQLASFDYDDMLMTWTNRQWATELDPKDEWGAHIYGEKGTLKLGSDRYEFIPADASAPHLSAERPLEFDKYPTDKGLDGSHGDFQLAPAIRAHMRDFLSAIATDTQPASNIATTHISTASCILANMSLQLKRPLVWDGETQRVIGDDGANAALARPYRAPWRHPLA